ncbi:hypothetical protein RIF29_25347 [Crotalaria pallida]|uniref:Ribonuclease H1 N-terminal domain-containing protein n=1 Tax=Crotalaria pallida TaxID=3830 RepID=A0AAN9HZQ2_CROPI
MGKGYRLKARFYNVYVGRQTGIYRSWHECHMQVRKYSGTSFQALDTFEEAKEFWDKHLAAQSTAGIFRPWWWWANFIFIFIVGGSNDGDVGDLRERVNGNMEAFLTGLKVGLSMTLNN